jgi:hypothetical protein
MRWNAPNPARTLAFGLAILTLAACGRSDQNPGFTPEEQQKLDGAVQTLDGVITLSDDVATAIGEVNPDGPNLQQQANDLDGRVTSLETDVALIELRIQPDGQVASLDSEVLVPDPTNIGFDAAENVTNVREALNVINTRLNVQSGQITTLQGLDAAIDQRITAAIDQLIADRIVPLEQTPRGFILGPSTATTDGAAGGAEGASAICQTDFVAEPTAHLCSTAEVQHALATAQFNAAGLDGVATWAIPQMTAIYDAGAGAYTGAHYDVGATSLTMSCNNLTDATPAGVGAPAMGSSLTVDLDFDGNGSNVYIVAPQVSCDAVLPVLCCR